MYVSIHLESENLDGMKTQLVYHWVAIGLFVLNFSGENFALLNYFCVQSKNPHFIRAEALLTCKTKNINVAE